MLIRLGVERDVSPAGFVKRAPPSSASPVKASPIAKALAPIPLVRGVSPQALLERKRTKTVNANAFLFTLKDKASLIGDSALNAYDHSIFMSPYQVALADIPIEIYYI